MSKFIKCWVFIICLLFIFLILFTDKVKAETCYHSWDAGFNSELNISATLNNGINGIGRDLTSNITIPSNTSYIKGTYYYVITDTNKNIISNINLTNLNLSMTCQNTQIINSGSNLFGYITYADGTSATISSTLKGVICDYYSAQIVPGATSVGTTTTWYYEPNVTGVSLRYITDNNQTGNCELDNNSNYKCNMLANNVTIRKFNWNFALSSSNSANIKFGFISNNYEFCISDSQSIINNQNQNAQQQHNDAQQQFNFISNETISNNTTSNVNNIDTSVNSDTKLAVTNFALIPLNFMQNIINSFSSSCSQVCIGNCGSGHINAWRFVFPCLDIESLVGSSVYTIIDSLFAFGMVFAFIRSVRKFFINALLLTADASSEVGVFL